MPGFFVFSPGIFSEGIAVSFNSKNFLFLGKMFVFKSYTVLELFKRFLAQATVFLHMKEISGTKKQFSFFHQHISFGCKKFFEHPRNFFSPSRNFFFLFRNFFFKKTNFYAIKQISFSCKKFLFKKNNFLFKNKKFLFTEENFLAF
jgi:hypothetical protein